MHGRATLAAVFAGGVIGTLVRVVLAETWAADTTGTWPWATFLANVVGACVLGVASARWPDGPPRALLGAGLCGALTTFSTLQLELVLMLGDGHAALALGYACASLAAGLAAISAGRRVLA